MIKYKVTLPALILNILLVSGLYAQSCFEHYQPGAASGSYTTIGVDKNNTVWVGTDKEGLYSYAHESWLKSTFLPENKIVQIAPDLKNGGIWVGQSGRNLSTYGGGVSYIGPDGITEDSYLFSFSNNNRAGYGLPTSKIQSVAIDDLGRVWAAGSWNSLYVSGAGSYHNPGGVSIWTPGSDRFTEIASSSMNYSSVGLVDGPRGKNVVSGWGSGCIRDCITLAPGTGKMYLGWKGVGDCPVDARIRAFTIPGGTADKMRLMYSFNNINTPFPFSLAISPEALAVDKSGNIWLGLNQGQGFGVYQYFDGLDKKNKWHNLLNVLPANTSVNRNAISASKNSGLVAIGTTFGLYIYKGRGDMMDMDSYYYFNTVNSNIPSDNVTGVAFDQGDKVWVATDNGVASIVVGEAEMYTLKTNKSFYDPDYFNALSFKDPSLKYQIKAFGRFLCAQDEEFAEVAADGSGATMFVWKGANPANVEFRIKEDELANIEEFGYFEEIPHDGEADSLCVRYYHPEYLPKEYTAPNSQGGRLITVEVVDKADFSVLFSQKIKVVSPPVLIMHGIFSDKDRTDKMAEYLVNTNVYQKHKVKQGGFGKSEDGAGIEALTYQLEQDLLDLQQECAKEGLSSGKADVLAHSTSGLAVRNYIQNFYRKDINKFIAIHVPNSGSQYVDLLADSRRVRLPITYPGKLETVKTPEIGKFIMFPTFFNEALTYEGEQGGELPFYDWAKDYIPFVKVPAKVLSFYLDRTLSIPPNSMDLTFEKEIKTDSEVLAELNSPSSLFNEMDQAVPTHAVVENYTYGLTGFEPSVIGKLGVEDKVEEVLQAGTKPFMGPLLRFLILKKFTGFAMDEAGSWLAEVGPTKGVSDYFMEKLIFNELNDAVVSVSSQIGGLEQHAVSYDTNLDIPHESSEDVVGMDNSFDNTTSHGNIFSLLRESASGGKFSTTGFNPPKLNYDFCEDCIFLTKEEENRPLRLASGSSNENKITLSTANGESSFYPGDSVRIDVNQQTNENSISLVSLYGQNIEPLSALIGGSTSTLKFKIPQNAGGRLLLTAEVYDTLNPSVFVDTLTINVQVSPDVSIDSIEVFSDRSDELYTFVESKTLAQVTAFYSDNSERVVNMDSTFTVESVFGRFSSDSLGFIKGIEEGRDILVVKYNDLTDTVYVQVLPKMDPKDPDVITGNNSSNSNFSFANSGKEEAKAFTVFPNPANDILRIRPLDPASAASVKIIDINGSLVKSQELGSGVISLDVSALPVGFYMVLINDQNTGEVHTEKVFIK